MSRCGGVLILGLGEGQRAVRKVKQIDLGIQLCWGRADIRRGLAQAEYIRSAGVGFTKQNRLR